MAYVSIAEAVRLTGKSRSTITRKIKSGGLSRDSRGIETSELIRVFGELQPQDDASGVSPVAGQTTNTDALMEQLEKERLKVAELEQELRQERQDAKHERERFLSIIENRLTHDESVNESKKSGFWSRLFK